MHTWRTSDGRNYAFKPDEDRPTNCVCVCISQKLRSARMQKRLLFVGSLALTGKYGRTHSQSSLAERVIQILHKHTHANTLQGLAYMSSRRARCGPAFAQRGPHASQRACTRGCVQMVHVNMSVRFGGALCVTEISPPLPPPPNQHLVQRWPLRGDELSVRTRWLVRCVYTCFCLPCFHALAHTCVCSGKCVC